MDKIMNKLYLDFDCTIVNSIKKIVSLYDTDFQFYKDYKKVHWTEIENYDFKELTLINKDIVLDYFDDHRFFYKLDYMDNAQEVLDKLKDKYDITVVSLGRSLNLHYKREWLHNNLPYVKFIGVDLEKANKSEINLSDGILIDDNIEMLNNSNAMTKIIFGDIYEWNHNNPNNYHRCWNWIEIEKMLQLKAESPLL